MQRQDILRLIKKRISEFGTQVAYSEYLDIRESYVSLCLNDKDPKIKSAWEAMCADVGYVPVIEYQSIDHPRKRKITHPEMIEKLKERVEDFGTKEKYSAWLALSPASVGRCFYHKNLRVTVNKTWQKMIKDSGYELKMSYKRIEG